MPIRGIKSIADTLIDYPGKPAAIIYFFGCDFRCGYCHNPGLVSREEAPDMPWARLIEEISGRVNLIEAVVVSGGEPTLNPGLPEFLRAVKEMELLTKLDTNGSFPEVIRELVGEGLLDYVAMDVKHLLHADRYCEVTGTMADVERIAESVAFIKKSGIEYEFRTTVVPGLHAPEEIVEIARYLRGSRKYTLQNFVPRKEHVEMGYMQKKGFERDEIESIREKCSEFVPTEVIGAKEAK